MHPILRLVKVLIRGGVLFVLLLPQHAAVAESLVLPATWGEFMFGSSPGASQGAVFLDATRPLPLGPVRQLFDEEDFLSALGTPYADAQLMTPIAAPEPSSAGTVTTLLFAAMCGTRAALLRRSRAG